MTNMNGKRRASKLRFRMLVLMIALIVAVTSNPVITALDSYRTVYALEEQSFVLTPEEGVTVTLSGMMPRDGHAEAVAADVEGEDILHAYDITIYYPDGSEFEPDEDAPITVSFSSGAIADAIEDENTTLEIAHISDDGDEESVELTEAGDDTASFEAESFSVYLIRTHTGDTTNHNPRRIYHFLSPDFTYHDEDDEPGVSPHYSAPAYYFPNKLNDSVCIQAIRTGESLQEIILPQNDNSGLFYGWYVVEYSGETEEVAGDDGVVRTNYIYNWGNGTPEHVAFNEPITFPEATEDEDIYLAPLFGRYRFLTFHQDTEGSDCAYIIMSRKLIVLNDERKCTLTISDVRAPSTDPNKIIFWGWKYTHTDGDDLVGQTEIKQTVTTEGEEIPQTITIQDRNIINGIQPTDEQMRHMIYDIWPIFKEARWVEFDVGGNGASYRSPQFIILEDHTTGFNNVPTRPGYVFSGWYYGTEDNMITDSSANILTGVTKELTTGVSIENGELKITSDAEGSSANRVFRAKWTPVSEADFHVIVWKQKVTDDKNAGTAGYPAKTYDFAGYFPLEGETLRGATGVDPRTTTAYTNYEGSNKGFENFDETRTNQSDDNNFIGFHYSYSTVSDDGMNHPTYDGKINPDGSTVVNVYYDRDLMTVTFHFKASQVPPAPATSMTVQDGYAYYETDDDFDELYGLVDGSYVPLTISTSIRQGAYVFSNRYTPSNAEGENMFGVSSDPAEYYLLERVTNYTWEKTGVYNYVNRNQANTNGTNYYGLHDKASKNDASYSRVWNRWQYSSGWFSSTAYNGNLYTYGSASGSYTGTVYYISNSTLTATTDYSMNVQYYGMDENNNVFVLTKNTYYTYTLKGQPYEGQRYTREISTDGYTGTRYVKENGAFVAVDPSDHSSDRYYGIRNGVYELLTKHEDSLVYEYTTPDGSSYSTPRYRRYRVNSSDSTFPYEEIWTGLFDQAYTFYGYKFPAEYRWNEKRDGSGSNQTMLTGFTVVNNSKATTDYHLYAIQTSGTAQIIHLKQKLDDTYGTEDENRVIAYTTAGSKDFTFTNKFEGFIVCGYSTTLIPSGSGSGYTSVSPNNTASINLNSNTTFYVYHKRITNDFVFNDNYSGAVRTIHNIKYERRLIDLNSPLYDPPAREHYTFAGWYEDSTCTQPFDFNTTMPAASKMVYAKWTKERYRIMVDPNGGEFPLGSGSSTFFNVDYDELVGEYADIRRSYVVAHNGDYVYANFQYDLVSAFPGVAAQPKGLAAVYRKAFYIPKNEIDDAYSRVFTIDGVDYRYADSGMTLEEFKSCIDMNTLYNRTDGTVTYELESWHKVMADGTVEQIPFNFKNEVTEDTTLRARWAQQGGFSLVYNPTMMSTGVTGTMQRYYDPLDTSRKYVDKAPVIILAEPSNITTTGAGGHEGDAEEWTFRGWRIVDERTGEPEEPGVFYDPGETMILDATKAGPQGVIHMEAYYEKRAATVRRPDAAALTLDSNDDTAYVNEQELAGGRIEYADFINQQIKLQRQINNCKVNLEKYIKNFGNSDGSLLLGWNTTREAGNYIPEYYADAEIGINRIGASLPPTNINTLYALWEPMVYLTLQNTRSDTVTFELSFSEYSGTVYTGYVNTMTGVYERMPFEEMPYVEPDPEVNNKFTVTLPSNTLIMLVIPEGVADENAPGSYTVSGSYTTSNSAKNLFVYNSGSTDGVSIVKGNNNRWSLNGSQTNANPIAYTTTGTLIKGAQGRLVRFTEENTSVTLHLTARYYDLDENAWKDADNTTDVNEQIQFLFTNASAVQTITDNGATTSVKLIDDSNHTTTFGMEVSSFNSEDYKCIGWYMTETAAPNEYSVDGHASDFGAQQIQPSIAIPPAETTYYALFVPYIKGDLTLTHSQRADSAGNCAPESGVGLRIEYYTDPDHKEVVGSTHSDWTTPAVVTLHEDIIYEKNTTGRLAVNVRAKPDDASAYKATYREQAKVDPREVQFDDLPGEGYYYAEFDAPVSDRFVDSDTVKGLKELRTINYYSVFSRAYEITYIYTARDGLEKEYRLTGNVDSFEDFEVYAIMNTPFVRTLAGDIVWDTDNIEMNIDDSGMHAVLREVSNVRDRCAVKVIESGGFTPTVIVPYGQHFTDEQAEEHRAPSTNEAGQAFEYWEITNTDTKEHIANCYSEKFTFIVWNNYTITPHYSDPPTAITDEGQFITIDYIDTSRNPWGHAVYNNIDETTDRSGVTDKVIADVDISFINNGDRILDAVDEYGNNLYQLGVMFEICGSTTDGSFDVAAYTDGESGRASRVQQLVANTSAKPSSTATLGGVNCYYTKININPNTVSTFNRSEFARSFTTGSVKNRVFRMYAYMVTPDDELILSNPKYLTLYDYALPEYAISRSK